MVEVFIFIRDWFWTHSKLNKQEKELGWYIRNDGGTASSYDALNRPKLAIFDAYYTLEGTNVAFSTHSLDGTDLGINILNNTIDFGFK